MNTATDDTARQAAMLEADMLQRAGLITFSQAKRRISERQAGPVAVLALQLSQSADQARAALRELHRVCLLMDHPDQMQRPTEDEYQAAMAGAKRALAAA